jgi:outer membrane receptor protein involved in Fe transport
MCLGWLALLSMALAAQTAPNPPATAAEEPAVELNPFVVTSTADTGYLASNTLAGSRMNTELRNVASVVSVFTPEFMADLGATTIEDLMEYGLNTQLDLGAGDFNHQGDQNSVADNIGTQKYFRVRGQDSTVAMEYFGQAGPLDTYNLERAELSSGPNARARPAGCSTCRSSGRVSTGRRSTTSSCSARLRSGASRPISICRW